MAIVTAILKQMPGVRQPQRKFLATLFATILVVRGRITCRNLSRSCDYSERTIARQFRASFEWSEFPHHVLPAALAPGLDLISAQDASFIPKSGKQTFGLGHFCSGCANRAERSLEISPLAVVAVTRHCACTRAVGQTPPGVRAAKSQATQEESRIDFYKQQLRELREQRQRLPTQGKYHCVDGYFAKKKYRDEVVALQLPPITKLRCDANCLFLYTGPHPKRRGPKRKYEGKVNFQDLQRFAYLGTPEEASEVHLYTALVWHVSLKRQLRVVVLVNRKAPAKPRSIVLASTALDFDGSQLVAYYVARFQIEVLFRDRKQFTGLTDCQARTEGALDFHFNATLATLNLVRAEALRTAPALTPHVFSMASWKQYHFNERLLDLCIDSLALDPTWVKNHPGDEELRTYGAIAA